MPSIDMNHINSVIGVFLIGGIAGMGIAGLMIAARDWFRNPLHRSKI